MIPQIIIISLWGAGLLLAAHFHGKEKKEKFYSFWSTLFNVAINAGLLYWGGFFDKMLQ